MPVVVSDTTPIHYLILVEKVFILEKLYGNVLIPPAVITELQHPSAPRKISAWAANPPVWVKVLNPRSVPFGYEGLDFGEREALALAKEMNADLILLDDKMARRVALLESFKVKGTLGILADAAKANLLDFTKTVQQLQRTSMHLDQNLVDAVFKEYERWALKD